MTRTNLEHIIRAAGTIADDSDIIVIGSQAVLGQYPNAPGELLVSMEADVYPRNRPEMSDLIDGSIGEGSPFERQFGYYAHGVDETTAILPNGWQKRLVLLAGENMRHIRGWCLEVHDLAISKLIAGRDKDLDFVEILLRHRIVQPSVLRERLDQTEVESARTALSRARIARMAQSLGIALEGL